MSFLQQLISSYFTKVLRKLGARNRDRDRAVGQLLWCLLSVLEVLGSSPHKTRCDTPHLNSSTERQEDKKFIFCDVAGLRLTSESRDPGVVRGTEKGQERHEEEGREGRKEERKRGR